MAKNYVKYDRIMIPVTGLCVLMFAGSLYMHAKQMERDARRVSSIAQIEVPEVPDISTDRPFGVISADEWSSYYPEIYDSFMRNKDNQGGADGRAAYTEDDPYITTLYQGIGFSFDYTEAVGHAYTLEDVAKTERPHKLANCLTCKTPDLTAMVNAMGTEVYSTEFDTVYAQMGEVVSCYSCHANTPGTMVISSDYQHDAMQDDIDAGRVDAVNVACGQCHIEYYFDKETKATKVPYTGMENHNPDAILAYYNEMGFVDFTNENTGVGMIKVQHPEFETFTGEGSVHNGMFNCADCHMGVSYDKDGYPYANHELTSPLDNVELINKNCAVCHKDLEKTVRDIQTEITGRESEVGNLLVEVNEKLADAVQSGSMSEAQLDEIRALDRDAQFYWDFVYVENSEGAHNSSLSRACLDKAEALAKQALELLN